MPLPTDADVIAYLRIDSTTAVAEAGTITNIRKAAVAQVEGLVRRPITAVERTFSGLREMYDPETTASVLHVPMYPVASVASVVDADGTTVAGADYTLDVRSGRLSAVSPAAWTVSGGYTVTATVGLSAHPDYATLIEPRLFSAILDIAADLYQRRSPAAQQEGAAGAYVGWSALAEVLPRVKATLGDLIPRAPMRV